MAFSYNTSNPGNRDKVRLLIGDTSSASFVFEDAELDMFLALWGNDLHRSAAQALRSLATDRAKLAMFWQVNGVSVNRSQQAQLLMEMADKLEAGAGKTPFEFESAIDFSISPQGGDESIYLDSEA